MNTTATSEQVFRVHSHSGLGFFSYPQEAYFRTKQEAEQYIEERKLRIGTAKIQTMPAHLFEKYCK